jgi:hypothetical protein
MEITTSFINASAFDGTDAPAHEIITRDPGQQWLVAAEPITLDKPIRWSTVKREDHVYIPLVPYLTSPDPPTALAFMLQLGMLVSFDVGRPIKRLHLAIGSPVNEVVQPGMGNVWQFQVGFGIIV